MERDRHGLLLHGNPDAVAAYDEAILDLVRFKFDVIDATASARLFDPSCIMAGVLGAYLPLMSSQANAVDDAATSLDAIEGDNDGVTERELTHLAAAQAWVNGDMARAGELLEGISIDHPRDLLALAVGHQIDFFSGDARRLRDRIGRALPWWRPTDEAHGYLLGMAAFGFEESNIYDRAARYAEEAISQNGDDVWAMHARAHVYEMQGRASDGIRFLKDYEPTWSGHNLLRVHNSWHFALFLLEGGDYDGALEVYDAAIRGPNKSGAAFELVDASALLWRLHLDGVNVGDRFEALSDAWDHVLAPGYYPFNDVHAALAYVGAGRFDNAAALRDALVDYVAGGDDGTTGWHMSAEVGLPVCDALIAFGDEDFDEVISQLWPLRERLFSFGGSNAQRDVVERTLVEASLHSSNRQLARALIAERLCVRPHSVYALTRRADLCKDDDDQIGADLASKARDDLVRDVRMAAS